MALFETRGKQRCRPTGKRVKAGRQARGKIVQPTRDVTLGGINFPLGGAVPGWVVYLRIPHAEPGMSSAQAMKRNVRAFIHFCDTHRLYLERDNVVGSPTFGEVIPLETATGTDGRTFPISFEVLGFDDDTAELFLHKSVESYHYIHSAGVPRGIPLPPVNAPIPTDISERVRQEMILARKGQPEQKHRAERERIAALPIGEREGREVKDAQANIAVVPVPIPAPKKHALQMYRPPVRPTRQRLELKEAQLSTLPSTPGAVGTATSLQPSTSAESESTYYAPGFTDSVSTIRRD